MFTKLLFIGGLLMTGLLSAIEIEGKWIGECNRDGQITETVKEIKNFSASSITINGDIFNLGRPTVRELSGNDNNQDWSERFVYDWYLEGDKIITSARWLGSFDNVNGAWSGRGTGYIQLVDGKLELLRKFSHEFNGHERNVVEKCILTKKE